MTKLISELTERIDFALSNSLGHIRLDVDDMSALRAHLDEAVVAMAGAQATPIVPDEMVVSDCMTVTTQMFAKGHNACRAAMLQSGDFRENPNSSTKNFRENAETSTKYPETRLTIGKGCPTSTLMLALLRRAEREAELEAMTPEERKAHSDAIEAFTLEFLPQAKSPAIPEGWALVPIDATRKMIDAAIAVDENGYDAMHKAMIAAAPQPMHMSEDL